MDKITVTIRKYKSETSVELPKSALSQALDRSWTPWENLSNDIQQIYIRFGGTREGYKELVQVEFDGVVIDIVDLETVSLLQGTKTVLIMGGAAARGFYHHVQSLLSQI